jgi:four helix bundle protein
MAGVHDARELDVFQLCDELRCLVRVIVQRSGFEGFPKVKADLAETVESPCPNIAEGFSRWKPKDNARFVRVAAGSLNELLEHLSRAAAQRLITRQEHADLNRLTRRALGAANRYAAYLETAKEPPSRFDPNVNGKESEPPNNEPDSRPEP